MPMSDSQNSNRRRPITLESYNKVFLIGGICSDIRYHESARGFKVVSFQLAVNHVFEHNGETKQTTQYVPIDLFGAFATHIRDSCRKGTQLMVEGHLDTDRWEKDGKKFNKLKVVAQNVRFLRNYERFGQSDDNQQDPQQTHYSSDQPRSYPPVREPDVEFYTEGDSPF
jgi:single-strand DNA-binding protein